MPLKQTIEVSVQRAYGANKTDNKYIGYTKVRMINARKQANALVGAPRSKDVQNKQINPLKNESIVSNTLLNDIEMFNQDEGGQSQ